MSQIEYNLCPQGQVLPAIEKENDQQEFSQDLSSAFEKAFDKWASGITEDGDDNG